MPSLVDVAKVIHDIKVKGSSSNQIVDNLFKVVLV